MKAQSEKSLFLTVETNVFSLCKELNVSKSSPLYPSVRNSAGHADSSHKRHLQLVRCNMALNFMPFTSRATEVGLSWASERDAPKSHLS